MLTVQNNGNKEKSKQEQEQKKAKTITPLFFYEKNFHATGPGSPPVMQQHKKCNKNHRRGTL